MSGVKSASAAIWLASVTAGTNFIFTFVGLFLVERIGRKSLTIGSLAGMEKSFLSMIYMTIRGRCRILESGVSTYVNNVYLASLCNFGVPEKGWGGGGGVLRSAPWTRPCVIRGFSSDS